ncbi:hypothetical protein NDI89_14290 [Natrinema sp. S1CR25-10]|uniref:Uncharacterized protein n=2 Tax=Natrinema salsiterrestre TaxID=2950540 RepID=A0A9Q4L576_9EURY|nr:hypothetical protein [Natrinema salsiterrestre]
MPSFTSNHGFQLFDNGESWEHRTDFEKLDRLLGGFDENGDRLELGSLVVDGERPTLGSQVVYATRFDGANGGEQIQAALDDLDGVRGTVVVPAEGPDDLAGYDHSERADGWLVTDAVTIPSETTLVLDGSYLFLDDAARTNLLRNELAFQNTKDRDEDITVVGRGAARLDGNAAGQNRPYENDAGRNEPEVSEHYGFVFHNVERLRVGGFTLGPTAGWGGIVEDFTDAFVHDIFIAQDDSHDNQDGISFAGPGERGIMSNLAGTVNDDFVTAYSALDWSESDLLAGDGGDLSTLAYRGGVMYQYETNETGHGPFVRLYTENDTVIRNVSVTDYHGYNGGEIKLMNNNDSGGTSDYGQLENITVSNCTCDHTYDIVRTWGHVNNVSISNFAATNVYGHFWNHNAVDGHPAYVKNVAVSNCQIQSGGQLFYQDDQGGELVGATFSDITHENPWLTEPGAKWEVQSGTWRDVTWRDIRVVGTGEWDGVWIDGSVDLSNVRFDELVLEDLTEGISLASGAGETGTPIAFESVVTRNVMNQNWRIDRDCVTRSGIGVASGTGERPAADDWQPGDLVQYTDTDDGSGDGLYMLLPDGTWCLFATDLAQ